MKDGIRFYKPLLWVLVSCSVACTRNYSGPTDAGNGCISQVISIPSQSPLLASQIDSIQALFQTNNLSTADLQFTIYAPGVNVGPGSSDYQTQVIANLFLNGLPVFNVNELFIFIGGKFDTAYLYNGQPVNNNVAAGLTLDSLRRDFLQHVSESKIYGPLIGPPFTPSASTYLDSCLGARLGYVDAVYVPGHTLPYGNLVKVWSVTPLEKAYPQVFVEVDNGFAWGESISIP